MEKRLEELDTALSFRMKKKPGTEFGKVLCGASAYEEKYYFNEEFDKLPEGIKQDLQIMCVVFTQNVGGVLVLEFDTEGNLLLTTEANEADAMYDDIGSVLEIKALQTKRKDLLQSLELYYRVFFLGQSTEEAYDRMVSEEEDE